MAKPIASYRCIDHLKAIAFDYGFTNENVRAYSKLSKTATWEALLETYGIPSCVNTVDSVDKVLDTELDIVNTTVDSKFLVR
jgi:hypothetical protein